jgi:cytidylate kinase
MNKIIEAVGENFKSRMLQIAIEGNIASGKSTLLRYLDGRLHVHPSTGQRYDISVTQEPVEEWTKEVGGIVFLEEFYKDPARNAYPFQHVAFITRMLKTLKVHREENEKGEVLVASHGDHRPSRQASRRSLVDGVIDMQDLDDHDIAPVVFKRKHAPKLGE